MHLIHDEHGNLCTHAHDHEHVHQHTYEHSHVHSHTHGHEDEHQHEHPTQEHAGCAADGCSGCAGHTHETVQGDKLTALLDYMLKHNEHHAAELDQVADKLKDAGKDAAAEQIRKAVDEYQKGNLYLNLALSMIKE